MKISDDKKRQIKADKNQLTINQIAKKYNLPPDEIKHILNISAEKQLSKKKTPKWFFAVLILLPVIFLLGLEIFLRAIDYGYNLKQWVDAGQGKYVINPEIGKRYFTSGNFTPNTIEDVFDQQKKSNSFRVFVLGESSAQGYPFNPMGSFSRYIRKRIELVYPATAVEVVNISMTAVNSYTILDLLPGVLEQKPDLILIYAGHNEYYGALGVGSVQSFGSSPALIKLMLYLNNFKTTQFVRNSVQWVVSLFASGENKPSGTLMSKMAQDKYIALKSDEYEAGLQQFQDNLTDILQLAKDQNVPVILGKLVSNLKDQKPFISIDTPGYKTADKAYEEAVVEYNNNNFKKAALLFRQAKDLDGLKFRAPEKINDIIDGLSKKYNTATVPIDSIFDSESPGGIAGDNLIVDHLHPNVQGYQIIGKAFYECMIKKGYLPKSENAAIPLEEQDSLTRANFVFTRLDSVLGNNFIKVLKSDWPYKKQRSEVPNDLPDFFHLFQPKDFIDSLAMFRIENKISWADAHLIAATYHLRRDELKEYLEYMNVLIYQYPTLRDLDGALKFFYAQNKIDLRDYTPKRNGLMALYIGNFGNAIRHLKEAYKLNPEDSLVLYNLSLAYSKKEDLKEALRIINELLMKNPNNPEAGKLKSTIVSQLKKM